MKLDKSCLMELKSIAEEAAVEAGKMILERSNSYGSVLDKNSGSSESSSVLTEVDLLSQEIILRRLNQTIVKFDLGLLTEESTDDNSRHEKDYFWSVDPLDGTLPFIKGEPGYSVSIALVSREGDSYIGVVYDPNRDLLYSAVKGEGLYKNKARWRPAKAKETVFTIAYDKSFKKSGFYEKSMDAIKVIPESCGCSSIHIVDNCGAVLNAITILENSPGCYFKFPKVEEGGGSLWDFSATVLIFKEAGLFVSDIEGRELNMNIKGTTFMNRYGIIFTDNRETVSMVTDIYSSLISS